MSIRLKTILQYVKITSESIIVWNRHRQSRSSADLGLPRLIPPMEVFHLLVSLELSLRIIITSFAQK